MVLGVVEVEEEEGEGEEEEGEEEEEEVEDGWLAVAVWEEVQLGILHGLLEHRLARS